MVSNIESFLNVLEKLKITSGTNDKINILLSSFEDNRLRAFLQLSLDNKITFGVSQFDYIPSSNSTINDNDAFDDFSNFLSKLSNRTLTGNAALDAIKETFSKYNENQCYWFERCLKKDLSVIGIGRSTVDKVWPFLCAKFKCNLAEEEDELPKFIWTDGASIEVKLNGVRTLVCVDKGEIIWIKGRSGLEISRFESIIYDMQKTLNTNDSFVLDGEVHCENSLENTMTVFLTDTTKTESDFKTNKAYQKYIREKVSPTLELKEKCTFDIFDIIPLEEFQSQECSKGYIQRRDDLVNLQSRFNSSDVKKCRIVESFPVKDKEEAISLANNFMALGLEGGILKSNNAKYEFKRARNFIKIKESTDELEAEIISYTISKDIYNTDGTLDLPQLGAWQIKYKNPTGTYSTSEVGTGKLFTKQFRQSVATNPDLFIGKIITVQAQRFSEDGILICPRVIRMRPDRTSLEE